MKRWQFKTKNFKIEWFTTPEKFDAQYMDEEWVKECRAKNPVR